LFQLISFVPLVSTPCFGHTTTLQGYFSALNLTTVDDDDETRFYCYSSGCLSLLLSRTNLDDVFAHTSAIQDEMRAGTLSPYHVVERFVNQSIVHESRQCYDYDNDNDRDDDNDSCSPAARWIQDIAPSLHILVTTWNDGVRAKRPSTLDELADYLVQTTYIPFVTGAGEFLKVDDEQYVLDGGFSRALHPNCDVSIHVPWTLDNLLHSLNPLMSKETARKLWQQGYDEASRRDV
jgi:hypothetical protein